jgi:hypothetical protein
MTSEKKLTKFLKQNLVADNDLSVGLKTDTDDVLYHFEKEEFYVDIGVGIKRPHGQLAASFSCGFYCNQINQILRQVEIAEELPFDGYNDYSGEFLNAILREEIKFRYIFDHDIDSIYTQHTINDLMNNLKIFIKGLRLLLESASIAKLHEVFNLGIKHEFPKKTYFYDIALIVAYLHDKKEIDKYLKKYRHEMSKKSSKDSIEEYNRIVQYICAAEEKESSNYLAKYKWYYNLFS